MEMPSVLLFICVRVSLMPQPSYAFPPGGMPAADRNPQDCGAVFTTSYALLPASTQRDIVVSNLPGWTKHRAWILARPTSGFAETFAQYAVELQPAGGSDTPEPDRQAQASLFVTHGKLCLILDGQEHTLQTGSFAYIPAGVSWALWNRDDQVAGCHWIRKRYVAVPGIPPAAPIVTHEDQVTPQAMPGSGDKWTTQFLCDATDLGHDFHVNIISFKPGGRIPFAETHVMEHGIYILQGTARYLLNKDWVGVSAGDFIWLRAFCPQACIATGSEPFRYLLYKDVNRHPSLGLNPK